MVGIAKSVGRGATAKQGNQCSDVRTVQCLLNLDRNRQDSGNTAPKLALNGKLDDATQTAIDLFQSKALKIEKPDGRVDKGGGMLKRLAAALPAMPNTAYAEPAWLKFAYGEEKDKVREAGPAHDFTTNTARILEYLETANSLANHNYVYSGKVDGKKTKIDSGYKMIKVEDTPWCACFVNWCLIQAGARRGPGASARDYRTYGVEAAKGQVGAICAIYRDPFGDSSSGNHVGFYIGGSPDDGYVALLGGNQDNKVCRKWFVGIDPKEVKLRWPLGS
jgi:uncharacterized protein (TIGR02594 family)